MASVMVDESLPPLGLRVGGRFRVPTVKRPTSGGECASVVSITTAARDRVRRTCCVGLGPGHELLDHGGAVTWWRIDV